MSDPVAWRPNVVPVLPCVVLDCTGTKLGLPPRLKLSSLSEVSLLLSVMFVGKKEVFLLEMFTGRYRENDS